MKRIYRADVVAAVPAAWKQQYAHYTDRNHHFLSLGLTDGEIRDALAVAATNAEIEALLPSWCKLTCDECAADCPSLIRFGAEPDYEARWQDLCDDCLRAGLATEDGSRHPVAADGEAISEGDVATEHNTPPNIPTAETGPPSPSVFP